MMNTTSTKALLAVLATAIGLGAVAPAMAQPAPPAPEQATAPQEQAFRPGDDGPRRGGPGGPDGFLNFGGGAEAIDVALVRLGYRLDLTAEQQTLLDALKTSALAAATDFETAVEGLKPTTPPAEGDLPDFAERFEQRIDMQTAQLAAMQAVQPDLTAFFDSLTDAQKADLMPQRGEGGWGPRGGMHGQHKGPHGAGLQGEGPRD